MAKRTLTIRGKRFEVHIGSTSTRIKQLPDGPSATAFNSDIRRCTPDTWERGQWKRTSDGELRPQHIVNWICKHILQASTHAKA